MRKILEGVLPLLLQVNIWLRSSKMGGDGDDDDFPKERLVPVMTIPQQVWTRSRGFIVGALVIVAALAWRDAIRGTVEMVWPNPASKQVGAYAMAILITFIAVLIALVMGHNGET